MAKSSTTTNKIDKEQLNINMNTYSQQHTQLHSQKAASLSALSLRPEVQFLLAQGPVGHESHPAISANLKTRTSPNWLKSPRIFMFILKYQIYFLIFTVIWNFNGCHPIFDPYGKTGIVQERPAPRLQGASSCTCHDQHGGCGRWYGAPWTATKSGAGAAGERSQPITSSVEAWLDWIQGSNSLILTQMEDLASLPGDPSPTGRPQVALRCDVWEWIRGAAAGVQRPNRDSESLQPIHYMSWPYSWEMFPELSIPNWV